MVQTFLSSAGWRIFVNFTPLPIYAQEKRTRYEVGWTPRAGRIAVGLSEIIFLCRESKPGDSASELVLRTEYSNFVLMCKI
jgi:hypothetical protein